MERKAAHIKRGGYARGPTPANNEKRFAREEKAIVGFVWCVRAFMAVARPVYDSCCHGWCFDHVLAALRTPVYSDDTANRIYAEILDDSRV